LVGNVTGNVTGNATTTSQTNFSALTLLTSQVWANNNNPISKLSNGYINFANGFQIRWATVLLNGATTITFPLAFDVFCAAVIATPNITPQIITTGSYTTTNFVGTNTAGSVSVSYIAIGY
jgi:hypothetical protein